MKKIMKALICAVASGCFLLGATSFSSGHTSPSKTASAPMATQTANFSFVIQLKQAKLTHIQGRKYQLSFSPTSITDGVLAASNAPNRFFRRLSFTQFKALVAKGAHSFPQDPPNMVLSGTGKTPASPFIATFRHKNVNNEYIIDLISLDHNSQLTESNTTLNNLTLFIDAYGIVSNPPGTQGENDSTCCCKGNTGVCFSKSYCSFFGVACDQSNPPITNLP